MVNVVPVVFQYRVSRSRVQGPSAKKRNTPNCNFPTGTVLIAPPPLLPHAPKESTRAPHAGRISQGTTLVIVIAQIKTTTQIIVRVVLRITIILVIDGNSVMSCNPDYFQVWCSAE